MTLWIILQIISIIIAIIIWTSVIIVFKNRRMLTEFGLMGGKMNLYINKERVHFKRYQAADGKEFIFWKEAYYHQFDLSTKKGEPNE